MVDDQNISFYEVQRSYDGTNFETIGTVPLNTHSYNDISAEEKNVYYRILSRDNAGTLRYTGVVLIRSKNIAPLNVVLAPNPVRSGTSLIVEAKHSSLGIIRIVNSMGLVLRSQNVSLMKGGNQITLSNIAALGTGTYQVFVTAGSNSSTVKMLVKP